MTTTPTPATDPAAEIERLKRERDHYATTCDPAGTEQRNWQLTQDNTAHLEYIAQLEAALGDCKHYSDEQAAALSTERHCYKTMKRQRDQLQARVAELEALKDD